MKIRHLLYAATAATIALASCNKDDGGEPVVSHFPEDGVIRVTTNVNEAALTRAGYDNSNLDNFWLRIVTGDGSDANYNYCVEASKSGSEWTHDRMLWKDKTTPITMTAAVFGSHDFTASEFAGTVDLTIPTVQSSEDLLKVADLLVMPDATIANPSTEQTLLNEDGKLVITLGHALTKLDIALTLNNEFYRNSLNTANIQDFTISTKDGFAFKASDGTATATTTAAEITPFLASATNATDANKKSVANFEGIVVPETATKIIVTFKIGTKTYSWTSAEVELKAGYRYAIALEVGGDVVTLGNKGIHAAAWDDQTPSQNGLNTY